MASSTPIRTLKLEGGTGNFELALKVFSGTVMEAFVSATKFWDNTGNIMAVKQLNGGRTAQWPILGQDLDLAALSSGGITKGYHTPGAELLGQDIKMSEATITCDDFLVAQVDIPFQDIDLSHFDVIQPFAVKLGRSLATDLDKKACTIAIKSAKTDISANIHSGGNVVAQETFGTSAGDLVSYYENNSTGSGRFRNHASELAKLMDEDAVPEAGRYLFIPPYIRQIMRHEGSMWGSTGTEALKYGPAGNPFSGDMSANSWDLNGRVIGELEGFNVIITNNIPTANVTGYTGDLTKYNITCDGSGDTEDNMRISAVALCGAQEGTAGIGMVQASGVRSTIERDERRNTFFMKAQILCGLDVLAPWNAGAIGLWT